MDTKASSGGTTDTAYGARPVSVDIARARKLHENEAPGAYLLPTRLPPRLPLTHQVVADRLALAHWPRGHQIIICSLDGGTGRTTTTGLVATVLAELPYAHIWHPIALLDSDPHTLGQTRRRWDVMEPVDVEAASTRSGAWALAGSLGPEQRCDFTALVVDAPAGLPSDLPSVANDPHSSIVLMTRPDRTSLSDAADALVWMNDRSLVTRRRVTVVINHGVGQSDRGSKAAATALGIRAVAIHSLPADSTVAPGRVLPSGRELPLRLRRRLARICLDVWSQTRSPTRPAVMNSPHPLEYA